MPSTLNRAVNSISACALVLLLALFSLASPAWAQSGASPTGLTVTAQGSSLLLSWNAASSATGYNVYRGTAANGEATTPIATGVNLPYTDSTVSANTTYYYKVSAAYPTGESPKSNEASGNASIPLLAPPTLIAANGGSKVTLSWTAISGSTSYNLYRSFDARTFSLYQLGLKSGAYADTAVTAAVAYSYYVCAVSSSGQGTQSNLVTLTPGSAVPPAPTGLSATQGSGSVTLNWNPVPGALSYSIYRGSRSGSEAAIPIAINVGGTAFSDPTVVNGTAYYYVITAVGVAGESGRSNEAVATPGAAPLAASVLSAAQGAAKVTLSWSAVPGATSYNIYKSLDGSSFALNAVSATGTSYADTSVSSGLTYAYYICGVSVSGQGVASNIVQIQYGTPVLPAPTGLAATASGGSAVQLTWNAVVGATSYNVYRGTASGGETASPIATAVSGPGYYDSSASGRSTYYYVVTAVSGAGESGRSNEASANPASVALAAPNLTASASTTQITLTWTPIPGATTYNLYRSIGADPSSFVLYMNGITASTLADPAVTPGVPYGYYVAAVSAGGQGTVSNTVKIIAGETPVPAPTGLAATGRVNSIGLTWNAAPGASSYNVYRGVRAGGEGTVPYATGTTSASYVDYSASGSTVYYYKVSAASLAGESALSNEANANPSAAALNAPNLAAAQGAGKITLYWNAVPGASSYNLYRSADAGATFIQYQSQVAGTSFSDAAVTTGIVYVYYLCGVGAAGEGVASNIVRISLGTPVLPVPSGLSATVQGVSVSLTWNTSPGATSYNVYRGTAAGGEPLAPYAVGLTSPYYTDYGVVNGGLYYYKVTAVNGVGESAPSPEASAKIGTNPLSAPALTASQGSGKISLTWNAVSGASSYNVYRSVDAGATFAQYQTGLTATTFADAAVAAGASYQYFVCAVNTTGRGANSNTVSLIYGGVAPPAPTGLTASGPNGYVSLSWNAVAGASYNIYRGTTAGGELATPYATGIGVPSYNDSGVVNGAAYFYKVTAVNGIGESARSNEASARVGSAALGVPVLTAAQAGGSVTLTWNSVSGATSYILFRSDNGATFAPVKLGITTISTVDSAVSSGATYSYYVCASSVNGLGSESNTVSVSIGTAALSAPVGLTATPSGSSIYLNWAPVPGAVSYNLYRTTRSGTEGATPYLTQVAPGPYADSSVAAGTTYFYMVTAVSATGESAKSGEAAAKAGGVQLGAPTLIGAQNAGKVTLTWSAVPGAASYNLYRSSDGGLTFALCQQGLTSASYVDASLTAGLIYGYSVAGVGATGLGLISNVITEAVGTPAPPTPAGLSASSIGGSVLLTWNPVPGASGYNIYRGTSAGGESATPLLSASSATGVYDSLIVNGTTYFYRVTAVNIAGESAGSNEASATGGAAQLAATSLTGVSAAGKITLTWSAVSGATSYNLYRSVDGGSTFGLYQAGLTAVTYSDTGVTSGLPYAYYVCGVNTSGQGIASNTVSLIFGGAVLPAPAGLAAQPASASIQLTWNPVPGAVTYNLYRGTTSGGEAATPVVTGISGPTYNDSSVRTATGYFYQVTAVNSVGQSAKSNEAGALVGATQLPAPVLSGVSASAKIMLSWSAVAGASSYNVYRSVDGGSTFTLYQRALTVLTFSDAAIVNGLPYMYYVCAANTSGQGSASNTVSLIAGGVALPAPTGLAAQPAGSTQISLTWNPSPGLVLYNVYRGTASNGEGAAPLATGVSSPAYYDAGLTTGKQYFYQVTAVNSMGESGRSNQASALTGGTAPDAPLLCGTVAGSTVVLSWSAVAGASTYTLYRSLDKGATFQLYQAGISVTTYTDTGVTSGLPYSYFVCALSSAGQGAPSNIVALTAGAASLSAPGGLTAFGLGSSIGLSWNAVTGAASYNVYRGTSAGGEGTAPFAVGVPGPAYTDSTVGATTYYYRVTAVSSVSESPRSNEASATASISSLAAPSLAATGSATGSTLVWSSVLQATSYNIYRSFDNQTFTLCQSGLTATTYADTGLTAGVVVTYYVCAQNASGQGPASNRAAATPGSAVLPAPTGLAAKAGKGAFGTPGVDLTWNPVPGATSYNIYSGTSAGAEGTTPIGSSPSPSFNYPYLVNNRTYYFQVTAVGSLGESGRSNEASAKTGVAPPIAPVLSATVVSATIALSWGAVSGATSYDLFRSVGGDTFILYQHGVTTTTYTDAAISVGVPISYYVCAANAAGDGLASNSVTATAGATSKPGAPVLSAFTNGYSDQITLQWSAVPGAQTYYIYRSTSAGGEGTIPVASVTDITYTDTSVLDGNTYFYKVAASNSTGAGPQSNEASATDGVFPIQAPTLSGVAGSAATTLTWTSVAGAASYDLFRSADGGPFVLDKAGVAGLTTSEAGLTNNVAYSYTVSAVTPDGIGFASNIVTLTPGSLLLPPPAGLAASTPNTSSIQLTWNAVAGASSYNVYRGVVSGGEGVVPVATGVLQPNYSENTASLTVGVTYYYRVTALDAVGEGPGSNEASAALGLPQLSAPSLDAIAGNLQVSLTWSSVAGASGYNIYRSNANAPFTEVASVKSGVISYIDTGLTNGVPYTYAVDAFNPTGQGVASNAASATPGSASAPAPTGLTATSSGTSGVQLTWNLAPGQLRYNIYRGTSSGRESTAAFATNIYGPNYYDGTATPGLTYYYYVTALNANGESAASNEASARPGVRALAAPVLVATPGAAQITLTWNSIPNARSYVIYRGSGAGGIAPLYQTGLTATTFTDTAVQVGVSYAYMVAGVTTYGLGTTSVPAYALAGGSAPAAPQIYAVAGESQTTLYWLPVLGATSYTLYRAMTQGSESATPVVVNIQPQSPISQYTDTGLTDNTTYYYQLSAANAAGNGALSNETQSTPPSGTPSEFLMSLIPSSLTIPQAQSDSTTVSIDDLGDFADPITLTVTGLPTGVTASFYPAVATSSGSTLFLMVGATAAPGSYTLVVTGTAGTVVHSVPMTLTVAPKVAAGAFLNPWDRILEAGVWPPSKTDASRRKANDAAFASAVCASATSSGLAGKAGVPDSILRPWTSVAPHDRNARYKPQFLAHRPAESITLLDEVGRPRKTIDPGAIRRWKSLLKGADTQSAARLHLWIGEALLGVALSPDQAYDEFMAAEKLAGSKTPVGGLAAYDAVMAHYYQGAYADAAREFAALADPKTARPGYDGRTCAFWARHAAACAGYHAERSLAGIPEPPRLDPLCGVASLAACLRGLHRPYGRQLLLGACPAVGDKRTLADLIIAGRKLGVHVRPATLDDRALLTLPKPMIAHFERDHFVAVLAADRTGVTYLCSDCGAWPGGSVHLNWKQWHMVSCGVYALVTLPNTDWDRRLAHLDQGGAPADMERAVRIASAGPLKNLLKSKAPFGVRQLIGTHSALVPPTGFSCVYRPDAQQCNSAVKCAMDGPNGEGPSCGDPVNLSTLEEEYSPAPDLVVYNPHGPQVVWQRIYDSMRAPQPAYQDRDFGSGWSNGYNMGVTGSFPNFYVFQPNGARVPVIAAAQPSTAKPKVSCSVQPGLPMLVEWDYSPSDPNGYFVITMADRTKYKTSFQFQGTGNYYIDSETDRNGNSLDFSYEVLDSANPPAGISGSTIHPLLIGIKDHSTGTNLLTVRRANDGSGNVTQVSDAYGRTVYYHVGFYPNVLADVPYYQQLDRVSQVVPANTLNPPDRFIYGYSQVAINGITTVAGAYQFLSQISTPSPAGTGLSTSAINYGANGMVRSLVDANGNTHSYRLIDGTHTQVDVYNASNVPEYTRTAQFDAFMNQVTAKVGFGETETFNDPVDPYKPDTSTDSYGNVTKMRWDAFGNLVSRTSPRGTVLANTYNYSNFALGELQQTKYGSKSPTAFGYFEPSGLIQSITEPQPGTSGTSATVTASYTYDTLGNLLTATLPGNNAAASIVTKLNYTQDGTYTQPAAIGQPLTITDALGHISHLRYDARGNAISFTDAAGNVTSSTYNLADQPLTTVLPATGQTGTGHTTQTSAYVFTGGPPSQLALYDESGVLKRATTLTYGPEAELLGRSGEAEPETLSYDSLYHVTSVKDGSGNATTYSYDTNGFLKSSKFPDGKSVQFPSYDGLGRPLKRIDANNVETDYSYNDPEALLTDVKYPTQTALNIHVTYDAFGRPASVTDGSGSKSYAYDDDNLPTSVQTTYPGLSPQTISYGYYLNGSRHTLGTPGGTFTYAYDASGRPSQVSDPGAHATNFTYTANDWAQSAALSNGITVAYAYNARGLLTDLLNKSARGTLSEFGGATASTAMQYDAPGNRTGMGVAMPSTAAYAGSVMYSYDARDQLINEQATRNGGFTNAFAYDGTTSGTSLGAGNPTTFRSASGNTFNADNQITAFKNSQGVSLGAFVYDGNGNPTIYAGAAFTYDPENRLTAAGTLMTAGHNAEGLRAWKQTAAGKTYFLYDGIIPVCELNAAGAVTAYNTFGPLGLISRTTAAATTYYTFDPQGNVAQRYDATGALISSSLYDAFGSGISTATQSDPFGYGAQWGYYTDTETGLVLCGHRYYDPRVGRWLTRDPIGFAGGLNAFAYVQSNPIKYIDPSGHTWQETLEMTWEWATGTAPAEQWYGPDTNQTQDMMGDPGVKRAMQAYADKNHKCTCSSAGTEKPLTNYGVHFGLPGLYHAGFNPTRQFVGSYTVNIYPDQNGKVRVILTNTTSLTSFLYGLWPNSWNAQSGSSFGNFTQYYTWTQDSPVSCP